MLWGIAIADTRVPGYDRATVEIARTTLTCRVDGEDVALNDDRGIVRGGLYRRLPWFGIDAHEPLPVAISHAATSPKGGETPGTPGRVSTTALVFEVGSRPDRVWHFWAASPRAEIPAGKFEGCTVRVRARISRGALLQVGFDYWRNSAVGYGQGGNNHEAGASDWYLQSEQWQDAEFTDIGDR